MRLIISDRQAMLRNASVAARQRGGRLRARTLWLRLHRWMGLGLGAVMALMGLTGSINVFYRELDVLFSPAAFAATASATPISAARALRVASDAAGVPVGFLYAPDPVWPVWTGFFLRHGSFWEVTVDPGSGRVLALRDPGHSPIRLIYQLHADLLLRPWWGEQMVGVLGLLLLLMAGSGLWLWWPRRGLLRALVRLRTRPRVVLFADLHALAGLWSALLLMVVSVTGVGVVFPGLLRPLVSVVSHVDPDPSPGVADRGTPFAVDADRAIAIALRAAPGQTVRYVEAPPAPEKGRAEPWEIGLRWQRGSTAELTSGSVWVDPWSGAVLAQRARGHETGGDKAMDLLLWIHNGSVLGWTGRIAVFLSGLSLPMLFTTGLLFWARKRRLRRQLEDRRAEALRGEPVAVG